MSANAPVPVDPKTLRTARGLAFALLDEHRRRETFVGDRLDELAREHDVPPRERSLARRIAIGTLRRRSTLDAVIGPRVARPRERVENELWTLLRIGTYQLVFLDAIPNRAAIHETVDLAHRLNHPRWAGFLNGVLRAVQRSLTDDVTTQPAPNAIPIEPGRFRVVAEDVLPDPETDPAGYVADGLGLPRWLVERWQERSSFADLLELGFWFDGIPPLVLRVNPLRSTREELLARLTEAGIEAVAGDHPAAVRLGEAVHVPGLPGFAEGWFTVQDESAMSAADLLGSRPGENVLDACAAPGTKTTHLAELMQDTGRVVACDVSAARLERVKENAERLGLSCVETAVVTDDPATLPAGSFDAILLDVPCSNTGVLGKRPEARWRLRPKDLEELTTIQRGLLHAALDRLAPPGRLVYSTCSIEPEENGDLVRGVLADRPGFEIEREVSHRPGHPADGAYQTVVRRIPEP